jgi:hypothetical protein
MVHLLGQTSVSLVDTLSKIAPHGPGRLGPVVPATIFIGFGERDAIMTTG